jgi:hypothetical protein
MDLIFLNIVDELFQSLRLLALSLVPSIRVSKQVQEFVETCVNKEV